MIVDKWDYRIIDLLSGLKSFIEESNYPITYNEANSLDWLFRIQQDPDSALIVNYREDKFSGFAIVTRETEAHTEFFGYLVKFYVMPSARGTGVSRAIVREMVDWFDTHDCVVSFATATAGIEQDKLFVNLLQKFQYVNLGGNLIRNQHGKSKKDI
jgi:GNAT superfamily N-acetyltransferase